MEHSTTILRIAIPAPLYRLYDYLPPEDLNPSELALGIRIKVPFGKREVIGILVEINDNSQLKPDQLKRVNEIIDHDSLFSKSVFSLLRWASDYYHYPLGEVFATALPKILRQGKSIISNRKNKQKEIAITEHLSNAKLKIELNQSQQNAINQVLAMLEKFSIFLLDGVTGSGKTEVYLQIIKKVIESGNQAIVLVPEIGLTPQIIERFQARFPDIATVLHSGLTDRERSTVWHKAQQGQVKIIIGTRSAIFVPLKNPGIIIIDEEHDPSFKQQEGFRYSARDLAIVRGRLENIPIVLGSATPSFESISNVQLNKYTYLQLPERVGIATPPSFRLLDLRNKTLDNGLSSELITIMKQHLESKGQILLFLNRRGFAPLLICHACGWIAACRHCDAKMTLHQNPPLLVCHHCTTQQRIDQQCPKCQNQQLLPVGIGTQRLEETLHKYFSDIGIVRIDRDSTRFKGSLQNFLQTIHQGENKILIGTQMLAKGHHFPNVTLVAILNADNGLYSADFRATEKIAQLLIQVAGRAGREEKVGEVIIQTHNPDHPLLKSLLEQGYANFARSALQERKLANLPPYTHFALLRAEAGVKTYPLNFLTNVANIAKKIPQHSVEILGPIPSLMERKKGHFRAQLLLQSPQRTMLHQLINSLLQQIESLPLIRRVRWTLDIDPLEVL